MQILNTAALCAAFLISISVNAMEGSSFTLYDGVLEFHCTQDSNQIKLTAKSTMSFSGKILAHTASGNKMSYGVSGSSSSLSFGFGISDFPIQFDVTSKENGEVSFTLDSDCRIKNKT